MVFIRDSASAPTDVDIGATEVETIDDGVIPGCNCNISNPTLINDKSNIIQKIMQMRIIYGNMQLRIYLIKGSMH